MIQKNIRKFIFSLEKEKAVRKIVLPQILYPFLFFQLLLPLRRLNILHFISYQHAAFFRIKTA